MSRSPTTEVATITSDTADLDGLIAADRVLYALIRPITSVRSLVRQPTYGLALLAVCVLTAAVGYARSGMTITVLNAGGAGDVTELLRRTRVLALLVGPIGELVKVGVFTYIFWASLVLVRPALRPVEALAAVAHAEFILVVGAAIQTLAQFSLSRPQSIADLDAGIGLNLLIHVPPTSPWLPVLSRINPFFVLWGVFLTYWIHLAVRITKTSAAAIVIAYWVVFTALIVSLQLMIVS